MDTDFTTSDRYDDVRAVASAFRAEFAHLKVDYLDWSTTQEAVVYRAALKNVAKGIAGALRSSDRAAFDHPFPAEFKKACGLNDSDC